MFCSSTKTFDATPPHGQPALGPTQETVRSSGHTIWHSTPRSEMALVASGISDFSVFTRSVEGIDRGQVLSQGWSKQLEDSSAKDLATMVASSQCTGDTAACLRMSRERFFAS